MRPNYHHYHRGKAKVTVPNTLVLGGLSFLIISVYCCLLLQYNDRYEEPTSPQAVFRPQLTLILTQFRSGSSWLGSIFDSDPDIFYLFEPLHPKVYSSPSLTLTTTQVQVQILKNVCTCNFDNIPSYGFIHRSNAGLAARTIFHNVDTDWLREECMEARVRVAKVVRIADPSVLEKFQEAVPECELSVVNLVRDPRASVNSIMATFGRFDPGEVTREVFTGEEVRKGAAQVCSERMRVMRGLQSLPYYTVTIKYEEMALAPHDEVKKVFAKLGIPMKREVSWHTISSSRASVNSPHGFDTNKNSKNIYNRWASEMDPEFKRIVTEECLEFLAFFDYPQ